MSDFQRWEEPPPTTGWLRRTLTFDELVKVLKYAEQSVDELEKVLKTKVELLRLTNEERKEIISKAKISELERQRKTLYDKLQEIREIKVCIQGGREA